MKKLLWLAVGVGVLALAQAYGVSIQGIKPNLALVGIAAASLIIQRIEERIMIVLGAVTLLKFSPTVGSDLFALTVVGAMIAVGVRIMPWYGMVNMMVITSVGTVVMYLLTAPRLLVERVGIEEVIMNTAIGMVVFVIAERLWQNTNT